MAYSFQEGKMNAQEQLTSPNENITAGVDTPLLSCENAVKRRTQQETKVL